MTNIKCIFTHHKIGMHILESSHNFPFLQFTRSRVACIPPRLHNNSYIYFTSTHQVAMHAFCKGLSVQWYSLNFQVSEEPHWCSYSTYCINITGLKRPNTVHPLQVEAIIWYQQKYSFGGPSVLAVATESTLDLAERSLLDSSGFILVRYSPSTPLGLGPGDRVSNVT